MTELDMLAVIIALVASNLGLIFALRRIALLERKIRDYEYATGIKRL